MGHLLSRALGLMLGCILAFMATAHAQEDLPLPLADDDEILIKVAPRQALRMMATHRLLGGSIVERLGTVFTDVPVLGEDEGGWQVVRVNRRGRPLSELLEEYRERPGVVIAEPNIRYEIQRDPNDPKYNSTDMWMLQRVRAAEAWETTTGSPGVVVAVIDTGVNYRHPDLDENIWYNPGESGQTVSGEDRSTNGKDDDGNGYIDDVHGIDVFDGRTSRQDPMDENGHGTEMAGVIGAIGNNMNGICGINWSVKMMVLRFADASGSGFADGAAECLRYIVQMRKRGVNVRVACISWGQYKYSKALEEALIGAGKQDVLVCCAAGNHGKNISSSLFYPASYPGIGLVSVAASDRDDVPAPFSNFSGERVHLAAPGTELLSTTLAGDYDDGSGTSQATALVSGASALLLSHRGGSPRGKVYEALVGGIRKVPAWNGKCVSKGVLDVKAALDRIELP
jgi:serine protease